MHTPSYAGVLDAARQIAPAIVRTPLIEHPALNAAVGGRVLMKAESLQVTGAFKYRGAYNRISRLSAEERVCGIVAYSSGNHAQASAAAAKAMGAPAVIVMPSDSPKIKIEGVKNFGGEVRLYDRWSESREAIGAEIARERGSILVPPFDDPFIIEGQGTCALELLHDADGPIDQLLCGASGGGLIAGINLVMAERSPDTAVYVVEPEAFDDTRRSLEAGTPTPHPKGAPSICDALMAPVPGQITFPINQRLSGALTVSDAEVCEAMRFAFRHLKLVIEPGGAVSLAALLAGKIDARDKTTAIIVSGGNVDPQQFAHIITGRFNS
ncbi:threonine/serine dehydratase [Brevundimonas sp.]|uniref:threonine ammonia-lyase n=1 Tax=Brevundimonas sp. TaxID=1871086 RepID=UPI00289C9706|nr:threonine/serine dehydratase [Brevundimonas sp.]